MRPIAYALTVVFGLLSVAHAAAQDAFGPPAPGARPKLRLEPANVELGEVYYGDSITGSLEIHNDGEADLVIADVKSSCGCTAAPLADADKVIPPGRSVTLPITMTPKSTASPLMKYLQIQTNDPDGRNVSVPVQCRVKVGAVAEPKYVLFRDAKMGDTPSQTIKVTSKNGEPFRITSIVSSVDSYDITWDREAEPALEHSLVVTAKPIASRNIPAAQIVVNTDHPRTKKITLSANTMVAPLVAKSTNRLMYSEAITPGATGETTIDLWRSADGQPIETLSVSMPQSPHITFDAVRDEANPRTWRITAHVPADETRPVIGSAVWLETDVVDEGPIAMMCVIRLATSAGGAGTR